MPSLRALLMPNEFLQSSGDRVLTSWENFLAVEARFSTELTSARPGLLARGQADNEWALRPSLHRRIPNGLAAVGHLSIERQILERFKADVRIEAPDFTSPADDDMFAWWDLLQHYGAPTRLLDWSTSMRVAAYFAVCERPESDGAIWLLSPWVVFEGARRLVDPDEPLENICLDPNAPAVVVARPPRQWTDRITAQRSQFTLCTNIAVDHGQAISSIFATGRPDFADQLFLRLHLPHQLKNQFLESLRADGISEATLFPATEARSALFRDLALAAAASALGPG